MGLFRLTFEATMADAEQAAELKKRRTFRKFTYRGVDLDQLLDMNNEQLMELFPCRIRRKFGRGLKRKPMALIKKLRKKKKEAPPNEKPGHCPRNDRIYCWSSQRKNLYTGRNQAGNDWSLSWGIFNHIQAC